MGSRLVLMCAMMLWGFFLPSREADAMDAGQMKALAGTGLLGLRADAVLRRCGLPAAVTDVPDGTQKKHAVRWGKAAMRLSAADWELEYGRQRQRDAHPEGWTNPAPGGNACLSGLSELVLHAKGNSGILSVKKRADNKGYITTYRVPDNLYAAHLVVGVTARWNTGMPVSSLQKRYGNPDEVVTDRGVQFHRYWVVEKNNKQMPISLHAVDFEIGDGGKSCARYIVRTSDVDFVQQKLDALMRQWEKDYVLD
jgi:hypothetical protein